MDVDAIAGRIAALFDQLSPQLQQAARYLLAHPDEVGLRSMRRLADLAGVRPATMVRLAQALEFSGYEAMREVYRERLRGGEGRFLGRARDLQTRREGLVAALMEDMLVADTGNLRGILSTVGPDRLAAGREALDGARRVYALGLRSCYAVAFFFNYTYRMFRDNCVLVDGHGGTVIDDLRGIGGEDVLLAISFPPYTRETVLAVEFAVQRGAKVVAITDSMVSPLAQVAAHTLVVGHESPSFFQSLVPALSMVQMLVAALVAGGGPQALAAIADNERQLAALDAYWDEDGSRWRRK